VTKTKEHEQAILRSDYLVDGDTSALLKSCRCKTSDGRGLGIEKEPLKQLHFAQRWR